MVISTGNAEDNENAQPPEIDKLMAPEKSRGILPQFTSLPCFNIKWGRQKQLRCVKHSNHNFPSSSSSSSFHRRSSDFNDNGIKAMREKLMLDFRNQVHQMKADFLKKSDTIASPTVIQSSRPWNLRTRRAVCKDPNTFPNISPSKPSEIKSPIRRNGGSDDVDAPRPKFSVSLSKQEIEEDFLRMVGTRPARRPKKRPKYVQKQLDGVFPGFWLSEITADMYKVNEQP